MSDPVIGFTDINIALLQSAQRKVAKACPDNAERRALFEEIDDAVKWLDSLGRTRGLEEVAPWLDALHDCVVPLLTRADQLRHANDPRDADEKFLDDVLSGDDE